MNTLPTGEAILHTDAGVFRTRRPARVPRRQRAATAQLLKTANVGTQLLIDCFVQDGSPTNPHTVHAISLAANLDVRPGQMPTWL